MKFSGPLVSCICVTKNEERLVNRAIDCFLKQKYINKELVILYESDNPNIEFFKKMAEKHENIKIIEIPVEPKQTLGSLRNHAIEQSSGKYFMQWDDDDWFGPLRIAAQINRMNGRQQANLLSQWIMFDETTGKAYLSFPRTWEGSILCSKALFSTSTKYPSVAKYEDTPFIEEIRRHIKMIKCPRQYIYTYHGTNTWDYDHFLGNYNYRNTIKLSESTSLMVKELLENSINMSTDEQIEAVNKLDLLLRKK